MIVAFAYIFNYYRLIRMICGHKVTKKNSYMQLFHRNIDIIKTICYKTPEQSCFRGLLLSDNYFLSVLYIYSRSEGRSVYSSSVEVIDDIVVDNRSISHGAYSCSCLDAHQFLIRRSYTFFTICGQSCWVLLLSPWCRRMPLMTPVCWAIFAMSTRRCFFKIRLQRYWDSVK